MTTHRRGSIVRCRHPAPVTLYAQRRSEGRRAMVAVKTWCPACDETLPHPARAKG